jgi:hypothetical protein
MDLYEGDFEGAWRKGARLRELGGDEPFAMLWLGRLAHYAGRADEAAVEYERVAGANVEMFSPGGAAFLYALRGERDACRALLGSPSLQTAAQVNVSWSWSLAETYAEIGDVNEALMWLENTIARGFTNHRFWRLDPFLVAVRGDPRFEALMEEAREKRRTFEV